jgi:hypothetical protein
MWRDRIFRAAAGDPERCRLPSKGDGEIRLSDISNEDFLGFR